MECVDCRYSLTILTSNSLDPNPHPSPGAASETFVCSGTTTSLAIPQATTTISVGGATIILNSGGTPVNGPLASQCTEVGGIIPLWSKPCNLQIIDGVANISHRSGHHPPAWRSHHYIYWPAEVHSNMGDRGTCAI